MIKVRTDTNLNELRAAIYFATKQTPHQQLSYKFLCNKLADLIEFNESTLLNSKETFLLTTADFVFEAYVLCQGMNAVILRLEQQLNKFSSIVLNNLTPLRKVIQFLLDLKKINQ